MNMYVAKLTELTQQKNVKWALVALLSLGIGAAGWFSFQWYTVTQGQRAQKILSDCLDEYIKAQGQADLWADVKEMNALAYDQVKGEALAPFFLMMQAQAVAHEGDSAQALSLMDQAIAALKKESPYRPWYATTKNIMLLDAQDASLQEQAITGLKELAADEQNMFRDSALYHLGEWYWVQNDLVQAKSFWRQLTQQSQQFVGSPWVALAEQNMESF